MAATAPEIGGVRPGGSQPRPTGPGGGLSARLRTRLARLLKGAPRSGSGLEARLSIRVLVWVRRVSQAGFLGLFLYFLLWDPLESTCRHASLSIL